MGLNGIMNIIIIIISIIIIIDPFLIFVLMIRFCFTVICTTQDCRVPSTRMGMLSRLNPDLQKRSGRHGYRGFSTKIVIIIMLLLLLAPRSLQD